VLFEDLSWMNVEQYLQHDNRVVVIVGSCEQHSHLSLLSDTRSAWAIAREACSREGVLIAPPVPFGISPYFAAFPGTISLSVQTFASLVKDIIEGLLAQGFRRVLVSNGHGGNTGVLIPLLTEMGNAHRAARLSLFHWWLHPAVTAVAREAGLPQRHANWSEAFAFNRVGPLPEGDKAMTEVSRTAPAAAVRSALGDGSYGGPYQAPLAVMDRMFTAAVEAMIAALREL